VRLRGNPAHQCARTVSLMVVKAVGAGPMDRRNYR
jgi:hypothetical protein